MASSIRLPAPLRSLTDRVISPWSEESIGFFLRATAKQTSTADMAWTANLAMFVPFHVSTPGYTVYEGFAMLGSGAGNNFDIGVYALDGTRLTSSGATARTASVQVNTTTMTDYPLPVGDYYMAIAGDSTSTFAGGTAATGIGTLEAAGVCEMAAAYVLPAAATLARNVTQTALPMFGLTLRTTAP